MAIELCAPHLELLTPPKVLEMLDQHLLLQQGVTSPLRASIEIADSALDDDARSLLRACSLCESSFELSDLEAITRREQARLTPSLLTLRQRGLVRLDPSSEPPRHRLLTSIRHFARREHERCAERDAHLASWHAFLGPSGRRSGRARLPVS